MVYVTLLYARFLRIIPAMQDAEINTGRFQMRRKGFHYYIFFFGGIKIITASIDIKRYWRNENFQ